MASCSERDFVWRKLGSCLEWCYERLRQGRFWKSGAPWRNLFDRLKYPTCDSGKSHQAVFLVAICSFAIMFVLAFALSAVPWPSYLVDSARYLLSALAQSVAALLAVCFTVAFVTFQVASSRLTPRAAAIILRSPALHRLLAIGASTILFSLAFLVLIPTPDDLAEDTFLIKLAVAAAATGVLAAFYVLKLVVLFFVYTLDYVRAETILEMHSRLLGDQQNSLLNNKNREHVCSDIQEELQVLTELGETLIKREDSRGFELLMEWLIGPFGQALDIQDGIQPGQDIQFGPYGFGLVGIYTVSTICELIDCVDSLSVKTRSQISQTESEDRGRRWNQFERDWIGPILTTAESLLDMSLRANTTQPLEAVLVILQELQVLFGPQFIRHYLESRGIRVAACIQKLDRAAQASRLHAPALKSGPIVLQNEKREHMRMLMDNLKEVIWLCFHHNVKTKLHLLDSITSGIVDDKGESAPMFKHWGSPDAEIAEKKAYISEIQLILWRALFEIGERIFSSTDGMEQYRLDYVEFIGKIFELEVKCGLLKASFLEDVLQHVWLLNDRSLRNIQLWLWLRIYLAQRLGIWPVTKCAPGCSLNQSLMTGLEAEIKRMPVDSRLRKFLTGNEGNESNASQIANMSVKRALEGLSKALHRSDDS